MGSKRRSTTSTNHEDLPFDIASASHAVQSHYLEMLAADVPARMAEMLALQSPPGVKGTDRTFMEGRLNNQQFDAMPRRQALGMIRAARAAGINPNGKYYAAGLADKRGAGDPEAWVDGAADIKRVAEKRNLTVSGAVTHKGTEMPPPSKKPLSDRLMREMSAVESRRHPSMNKREIREMVIDKYARKKKTK